MNQKQLQYFLTAYETKNIQQAADRLFLSRQGVSKIIRELENELGAELFYRSPKGLEPTEFAKTLLPHAKKLLDEYLYITSINTLAKQNKNIVTIYALDNITKYLTAKFFHDYRSLYPDIILNIVESTDDAALNALLTQSTDFAITTGLIDNTQFSALPLFYTNYCVAISLNNPLAAKEIISYSDINNQKIISKGRAFSCYRTNMEKYIFGNGLHVDILAEITDSNVALDLVKEQNAIYLSYDYIAVMHKSQDILWKYLDAEITGQYMCLVTLKNTLPRKVCRDFQNFLSAWLIEHHKDKIEL